MPNSGRPSTRSMTRSWCCAVLALAAHLGQVPAQENPARPVTSDRRDEAKQRQLDQISAVVQGQCIDATTGKPLAGCRVKVRGFGGRRDPDLHEQLVKPEPVLTGDDGRFSIRVLARSDYQVGLEVTLDGRWPRTGRWRYLRPGHVEDVGQVELHEGVYARGRIVDNKGRPMPGVEVGIDELPLYIGVEKDKDRHRSLEERLRAHAESGTRVFHLHANKVRYGGSGADGLFQSKDALPPGTHKLRISHPQGLSLVEPTTITIPERGPMEPITIVVHEEPFLAGVVVDEKSQPVAGVHLMAETQHSSRMASAVSQKDGTFKIHRIESSPDEVRISILEPGPCEPAPPTPPFPWGKHDVRIVLQRALSVDISVVEAGTGKAIEDFAVRAYPMGGSRNSSTQTLREDGHHAGGMLTVDRVQRGPARIAVVPKDATLLPAEVDVVAAAGMAPLRFELQRLVPMMVQVLDPQGMPASRVDVLVIVAGNWQGEGEHKPLNNPRSENLGASSSGPTVTFDTQIYQATTDEGGQCIVYGIDGRDDLILGLRGDRRRIQRVSRIAFGKDCRWREVRLERQ